MSYYALIINKSGVTLEVESTQADFIAGEWDKWLGDILKSSPEKITVEPVKELEKDAEIEEVELDETEPDVKPAKKGMSGKVQGRKVKDLIEEKIVEISSNVADAEPEEESIPEEKIKKEEPEPDIEVIPNIDVSDVTKIAEVAVKTEASKEVEDEPDIVKKETSIEKVVENVANAVKQPKIEVQDKTEEVETPEPEIKPETKIPEILKEETLPEEPELKNNELKAALLEEEELPETVEDQPSEPQANNKFCDILQSKFSGIPERIAKTFSVKSFGDEPSMEEIKTIEEFIHLKQPESMLDYLLISAYYLKEYEKLERYSLKQINAKIISFTKEPVDHSVVQKAVSQNYIEVVPDFTGMAGVTEYKITEAGEEYLLNEL